VASPQDILAPYWERGASPQDIADALSLAAESAEISQSLLIL
jgi:hypothetical protein